MHRGEGRRPRPRAAVAAGIFITFVTALFCHNFFGSVGNWRKRCKRTITLLHAHKLDVLVRSTKNGHFMLPALKIEFLFFKKSQVSFIAHMKPSILYKIMYRYLNSPDFAISSCKYTRTLYTPGQLKIIWELLAKESADILSFCISFYYYL